MGDERWWCEEKFGKKNTALYQPLGTLGVYFHLYAFWKMVEFCFRMVWVDWLVMIKKERGSLMLKRLTKDFKWMQHCTNPWEYSIVPTPGNFGSLLSPLCFLKNGRIWFQNGMGRLACHDKERKRLTFVKKIDKGFQMVTHIRSLISVKGVGSYWKWKSNKMKNK